jgi:hypothetical protein
VRLRLPAIECRDHRTNFVTVELLLKYLENAIKFRNLAAVEPKADLRAALEKQAEAYHKLAEGRAKKLNLPLPGSTPD